MDPRAVPAAHSMDTAWFGVDIDGNLALFDTGEAGAFPEDAAGLGETARPVGGHEDGFAAICEALHVDHEAVYDPEAEVPVYRYAHLEEYYIADRYQRSFTPQRPSRIEEVPPELRPGIVKLPVRFAAGEAVQPVEHVPAIGWSAIWRSVDGAVVRPFPDQVREAPGQWRDLAAEADGVRFDPDPGPARTRGVNAPARAPDPPVPKKRRFDPVNATPEQMRAALGLPPRAGSSDSGTPAGAGTPTGTPTDTGVPTPKKPWWKFW